MLLLCNIGISDKQHSDMDFYTYIFCIHCNQFQIHMDILKGTHMKVLNHKEMFHMEVLLQDMFPQLDTRSLYKDSCIYMLNIR